MLELRNISKSYGPVNVLKNISLTIIPGEILAIVGPSGAGKTTLLQIAGTLDRPDSGEVIFDGKNLLKLKDRKLSAFRNKNLGFIFQFHQLLPEFSALENVALPALISGKSKKQSYSDAKRILEELGMSHRLTHKPAELSGGEKQRAAIARALINNPSFVLADEPTGSLDSKNRDEIKEIISGLRQTHGQAFVIVTHDPEMAMIADRTVSMADGEILIQDDTIVNVPGEIYCEQEEDLFSVDNIPEEKKEQDKISFEEKDRDNISIEEKDQNFIPLEDKEEQNAEESDKKADGSSTEDPTESDQNEIEKNNNYDT